MKPKHSHFKQLLTTMGLVAPRVVTDLQSLIPGRLQLQGKLAGDSTILSPIRNKECLAFEYKSFCLKSGRITTSQYMRLFSTTVYAKDLQLIVDDGVISMYAKVQKEFSAGERERLKQGDIPGFKESEFVLVPGVKVICVGQAKWVTSEQRWIFMLESIRLPKRQNA
jgi:hypothetical protein